MANYYGAGRSNYFAVKDEAAFRAFIGQFNIELWTQDEDPTLFGFGLNDEDGSIPSQVYDPKTDESEDVDFIDDLRKHLADGHVCVITQSGHEKLRYVDGFSFAFDNSDEPVVRISLSDIYQQAAEAFGADAKITDATY